jgi:hypothetical protein
MGMMHDLPLGVMADQTPVTLPLDVQTQGTAVLGIRGSGKTTTAVVITEGMLDAGQQVVILDPQDVWWGLKSSHDGQRGTYQVVVFGGSHADIEVGEADGKAIADLIVEKRISAILSLRHLSKGQSRRFATDFTQHLYHRKGEVDHRTPLLVVIDEASTFVPQRVMGEQARLVSAIEDLVRRGRSSGLGVMLIDQRAASVNKDVLSQCETVIAHRHNASHDRQALDEWIQAHDTQGKRQEFLGSLASLGTGEAWVWDPHRDVFARVRINPRRTFDSSRTPKRGEVIREPRLQVTVDLDHLRARLAELKEPPKRSAARERPTVVPVLQASGGIDERAVLRRIQQAVETAVASERSVRERERALWRAALDRANQQVARLVAAAHTLQPVLAPDLPADPVVRREALPRSARSAAPVQPHAASLSAPERSSANGADRMLAVLGRFPEGMPRRRLALLSLLVPSSGTFKNYLSQLRQQGCIAEEQGEVRLTADGHARTRHIPPRPTGTALIADWQRELGENNGARRLFDELVADPSRVWSRQEAAFTIGLKPTSGTFKNYVSRLTTLGLIDKLEHGDLRISQDLVG